MAGADRVLGIFAKRPEPGRVKSRLAAAIGPDAAARLYDAFLRDLLPRMDSIADHRVLAYAEPDDRRFFAELCGGRFAIEAQRGGDLGARMEAFFHTQFERGAGRVVLIGSDSPDLPVAQIDQAFQSLEQVDVVIGPSEDGGYYLIGMRRAFPRLFDGIGWSTSAVYAETVARATQAGVRFSTIAPWYDVDIPSDLDRLRYEIEAARRDGRDLQLPHTEAILEMLYGSRK